MTSQRSYQVEMCVNTAEDAVSAKQHGADRLELSARLDLDGLNPSLDTIIEVRKAVDLPLHVIIRPRSGNFVYSEQEVLLMLKSIKKAKDLGVDGIVAGALLTDGKLDVRTTARLIRATHPLSFTFNRAFDTCWDPLYVYELLDRLGVDRLLTSGHELDAVMGASFIEELVGLKRPVSVVASGGVNQRNVKRLWDTGVRQFHINATTTDEDGLHAFDHEKAYLTVEVLDSLE